ncbi:MAG: tetratricopeptide repeat protein [Deltaproteobacteria bacterium]|nr:tetratricopeptide repeat protein [Deltaproteobacteria bacterium]MBW2393156.1 tetratricopeptide repeat protein [Deltaproteobacteria bacterium]
MSSERLRYWERTELVSRSADADGRSVFAFEDLLQVRSLLSLVEEGVSVRRIRRSLEALRDRLPELERPLRALRLSTAGAGRVAVRHDDALIEPDGQLAIDFDASQAGDEQPTPLEREGEKQGGALAWFERGCELDAEPKRLREAIDAYRQAITLDPDFADAHCNLGTLYFNHGDREQARHWYAEALEREPSHLEAHFNLANLCEEDGRRESAVHHYKAALQADPFFSDAHLNLALLYEKLELNRMAREHWRLYLQQVPDGNWSEIARQRVDE